MRPAWVKDAERTAAGTLLVVERTDGALVGYRIPTRSLREVAERQAARR